MKTLSGVLISIFVVLASGSCRTEVLGSSVSEINAEVVKIGIHVGSPSAKISPTLYGQFFEEINFAGDGGLYAEMIRNRSFEDADAPTSWSMVTRGEGKGQMSVDRGQQPVKNPNNTRSLRLTIGSEEKGFVGVANNGYWGIAVESGKKYDLTLYAKCSDEFSGPINVSIESKTGKVYAKDIINNVSNEWKPFSVMLVPDTSDPSARLVIGSEKKGVIWLDMVSLFPKDTWKNRPNGLRSDLAGMLADLKPAFIRFPGGCWIEGNIMQNGYRWKNTIGELRERKTQFDLWGYMSTNGLGFYEYLQMCEDMGAEPMYVFNCGMSHTDVVPMQRMQEWVQDALDAIEYANGPTSTKWGALRAKNGHVDPFNMKYVSVGNENGGPAYQERYALFYDAIKKHSPNIKIIATAPTQARPADMVDEHYYADPDFFYNNAHKYDSYDRRGPGVYVGEYAVTKGCGNGNLRAALAEAAFMTGMERNSDIVKMSCYAPLMANVNAKQWNPDLINFDSSRCYGTPSYYVQWMFSRNKGDVVLPIDLITPSMASPAPKRGCVGVGTWLTQAEFKDIVVSQGDKVLYASDFSKGKDGWADQSGTWEVVEGALRQTGDQTDCRTVIGDPSWTNYTLSLNARKLSGNEGFLILFGVENKSNWAWWNVGGWDNTTQIIEYSSNGIRTTIGSPKMGQIEPNRWYNIKLEVQGRHIRCYLDGKLVQEGDYPPPITKVFATASKELSTGDIIIKAVNASSSDEDIRLSLDGVRKVAPEAEALILTSQSLEDENSLDNPKKVAPVSSKIGVTGSEFNHTFPANSVTVLRIHPQK